MICAVAVGVGIMAFSRWQRENGMRPLYTSLSPEDASAMVQKLREGGVITGSPRTEPRCSCPRTKWPSCGWKWRA